MRVVPTGRDGFRVRLEESLARTGVSQSEVARRVGVKRATVSAWVGGTRTPDIETTRKLAALFEWRTQEMLSWFGIYEPVQHKVDSQELDSPAILPADSVTSPVTPPPQTHSRPRKESLSVPSPSHAAIVELLSYLPQAVILQMIPAVAQKVEEYLRGQQGPPNPPSPK